MEKEKKRKIYGTIIAVIAFIAVISGATYAYLTFRSDNTEISGRTGCFNIDYTAGTAITGSIKLIDKPLSAVAISSVFTYDATSMATTTVSMGVANTCTIGGNGTITLNTTSVTGDIITDTALNFVVVDVANLVLAKGVVTATNGNSQVLYSNFSLSTGGVQTPYKIILWADASEATNDSIGSTYTGYISASATQTQA